MRFALVPAEMRGGGFQHGAEALVLQVLEAKGERVCLHGAGQVVHMRLAGEVVGGGGQAAIRTLAQRRLPPVEFGALLRHVVRRADAGRP